MIVHIIEYQCEYCGAMHDTEAECEACETICADLASVPEENDFLLDE